MAGPQPHRVGALQDGRRPPPEGVFLSCIPFLFDSISLTEETRWILNYFQDFCEILMLPHSSARWHGWLRSPPGDRDCCRPVMGHHNCIPGHHGGTGSCGRGSRTQMHQERDGKGNYTYFLSVKKSFSNTPPCSFKPGDSPKHSSYLIPLRHFDTTI